MLQFLDDKEYVLGNLLEFYDKAQETILAKLDSNFSSCHSDYAHASMCEALIKLALDDITITHTERPFDRI